MPGLQRGTGDTAPNGKETPEPHDSGLELEAGVMFNASAVSHPAGMQLVRLVTDHRLPQPPFDPPWQRAHSPLHQGTRKGTTEGT